MTTYMYNRSKVMLKNAYSNLEDAKQGQPLDDAFFDIACYNAQQALEFILKAILLEYNIDFPIKGNEGHNILMLTNLILQKTSFHFEKSEELETIATTITMWETKSRYQTGIKTKEDTVRRVLNIYKAIDEEFTRLLADKSNQ